MILTRFNPPIEHSRAADVRYEWLYVEQEKFEKYLPKNFTELRNAFKDEGKLYETNPEPAGSGLHLPKLASREI